MKTKKTIINSTANLISFILTFIPNLIIRKIFLEQLGNEMMGLMSLYSNIIGWLSILDMGIGSAIIFSLYKPYSDRNYEKVCTYINYYGKIYKVIGTAILLLGIFISPFIRYFIDTKINYDIAVIGMFVYVANTFISYMFSYKICILNVAQESYIITISTTISKFIIFVLQFIMLKIYPNFLMYILIQLIINLLYYLYINIYINKRFNWITQNNYLKIDKNDKINLQKNIKAMFTHKIATLVVNSTDNIVISKFLGLSVLTVYTNYQLVITSLQTLIQTVLNGVTPSIGHLILENNNEKSYDIHKKLFFINFWMASFIVISLYNTLNQFIGIWLGESYLIDCLTFNVLMINLYFKLMRGSVEQFQSASGLFYQDRYAPVFEAIINLIMSIILVKIIGLPGVFIGTLISNFSVIFWTKPYIIYKYIFNKSVIVYFKMYFSYIFILLIPLFFTNIIISKIKFNYTIYSFIINCLINIIFINIIFMLIFYKTSQYKYFKNIIIERINKKVL